MDAGGNPEALHVAPGTALEVGQRRRTWGSLRRPGPAHRGTSLSGLPGAGRPTRPSKAHPLPSFHSDDEPESAVLPKDKLISLCKHDPVLRWMRSCDHILYQALVEILIPDVLRPVPSKRPEGHARPSPAPPSSLLSPRTLSPLLPVSGHPLRSARESRHLVALECFLLPMNLSLFLAQSVKVRAVVGSDSWQDCPGRASPGSMLSGRFAGEH